MELMSLLSKILQWSLIAYKPKLLSMAFNDAVQSGPNIKSYYHRLFLFDFKKYTYLSLAALSLCRCAGAFSSCTVWVSHCGGFSCCRSWALGVWAQQLWLTGSRVQAQVWCMGFAAPWPMGSSWTRDWTRVPCTARWILNHWTTREVVFSNMYYE